MTTQAVCEGITHLVPRANPLPKKLIQAKAATGDKSKFTDLARASRTVLRGLVTFFNIRKPNDAIFCSRDRLKADSFIDSDTTLYRGLKQLEDSGYIRREQDRRKDRERYGQFSISRIWLTSKAISELGIASIKPNDGLDNKPEEPKIDAPEEGYPQEPSTNMEDRLQGSEHTPCEQFSMRRQPPSPLLATKTASAQQGERNSLDIHPKHKIPNRLVRLFDLGLSKGTICYLMSLARKLGKQGMLSDVVQYVWHSLSKLRGRSVVAYLSTLLRQDKDWAWMNQSLSKTDPSSRQQREEQAHRAEKVLGFAKKYLGFSVYAARDGSLVGTVTRTGIESMPYAIVSTKTTNPFNGQALRNIEEGLWLIRGRNGAGDE